ncbi:hypothetical protein PLICRDRAFT_193474 [Plicaturopsis crispa FD-325 SS-3]|nr:hypothetical protein PLICRDRAFT_193474 [Plicaturopsis crispa FD-325 SS-3]
MADMQSYADRLRGLESMLPEEIRDTLRSLAAELLNTPATNELSPSDITRVMKDLPTLSEDDIIRLGHRDAVCPICFNTLLAVLAEEEMALAMESPAHAVEDLGVTRLHNTCGHIFCRRDISKWIRGAHASCPMCRRPLIDPPSSPPAAASSPGIASPPEPRTIEEEIDEAQGHATALTDVLDLLQTIEDAITHATDTANRALEERETQSQSELEAEQEDRSEYSGMYS